MKIIFIYISLTIGLPVFAQVESTYFKGDSAIFAGKTYLVDFVLIDSAGKNIAFYVPAENRWLVKDTMATINRIDDILYSIRRERKTCRLIKVFFNLK